MQDTVTIACFSIGDIRMTSLLTVSVIVYQRVEILRDTE